MKYGEVDGELQNSIKAVMGAYGQMHFWAGIGFFFWVLVTFFFFGIWILAIQGKILWLVFLYLAYFPYVPFIIYFYPLGFLLHLRF